MRYSIEKSYVYVVLEHHTNDSDSILQGVYTDLEMAQGKKYKILKRKRHGYVSILKKPINGIIRENKTYFECMGVI